MSPKEIHQGHVKFVMPLKRISKEYVVILDYPKIGGGTTRGQLVVPNDADLDVVDIVCSKTEE